MPLDPFATPVDDPFMQGGSAEAIKFETPGQIATIVVRKVDQKIDTQPDGTIKTWKNGDPMHVFVFTGESDGVERSLWVRGNMVTAIRDAVTAAGLDSVVNTKLTVKFDSLGTPSQKGFNPPKLFKAKVEKVAAPAVAAWDPETEPF
jgi:hypothetical protein